MRRYASWLVVAVLLAVLAYIVLQPSQESNGLTAQVQPDAPISIEGFTRADGPRLLSFPKDFGPHTDFRTEWWYYTGNVETADGRHFGYELTFFRGALLPPDQAFPRSSEWATNQIYMAHFALTDVDGEAFHAVQRYSRGSTGLAGAQSPPYRVWLEDWSVEEDGQGHYVLHAAQDGLVIDFVLEDEKGPILHGHDGYSQKGPEVGAASYYYSQTQLVTEGTIQIDGEIFAVSGLSWKDHEFSTSVLSEGQVGWDWFSIQLNSGYELMLYQIRQADGSIDPFSSGTLIRPDGSTQDLARADFNIEPVDSWTSPHSGGVYPMGWVIRIPSAGLEIELTPYLLDQELNLSTIYWEGAVKVAGSQDGLVVIGDGYVELTGYAEPFNGDF